MFSRLPTKKADQQQQLQQQQSNNNKKLSEQPPYMQISHMCDSQLCPSLSLSLSHLSHASLSLSSHMQNQIIQIQLLSILFIINAHNCQIWQIYERSKEIYTKKQNAHTCLYIWASHTHTHTHSLVRVLQSSGVYANLQTTNVWTTFLCALRSIRTNLWDMLKCISPWLWSRLWWLHLLVPLPCHNPPLARSWNCSRIYTYL